MTTLEIDFGLLAGDGIETRSAKAGEIIYTLPAQPQSQNQPAGNGK